VNEADRRTVLRLFPYGLYAITVRSGDQDHGITAAWVMQASFAPSMLVASVESESRALPMIRDARAFAVNVLASEQRDLASRLGHASPTEAPPKLAGTLTKAGPVLGVPVLTQALGWLECRLVATMPAGDHTLVLGEIVEAGAEREGTTLTLAETGMKYSG
jgi:flavin reductase (DIM6/NTAB) family NADH-FMN oxidoreductase RutF